MITKVKVNPAKIKIALLREGYASISEFCSKHNMTSSTITNTLKSGECTYKTAFNIIDKLGIPADEFILTE